MHSTTILSHIAQCHCRDVIFDLINCKTRAGWDTTDFGGHLRLELVDAQGQSTKETVFETGVLKEEEVPDFPKNKKFPKGCVRLLLLPFACFVG